MPKIAYETRKFTQLSLAMIHKVNATIEDYKEQGYTLSLRQIYYRLVAAGFIPNNDKEYKKLGELINNGRLSGLIDWSAIEDRTRHLRELSHWANPGSVIRSAARSYAIDKWLGQENRVEVWVEKDALVDVIGQASEKWDTPYFSCRGYTSATEMWNAAQRIMSYWVEHRQQPVIIHLGDHDPSGIDMSRDIEERLNKFCKHAAENEPCYYGRYTGLGEGEGNYCDDWPGLIFHRVGLNRDQIDHYNPPPNPTKLTDTRCTKYIEEHGHTCWELDALEPAVLAALIDGWIESYCDSDMFNEAKAKQDSERRELTKCSNKWNEVVTFLQTA